MEKQELLGLLGLSLERGQKSDRGFDISVFSHEILGIFCEDSMASELENIFKYKKTFCHREIFINGERATEEKLFESVAFANDIYTVINDLSVAENIFLGRIRQHERFALVDRDNLCHRSRKLLCDIGLSHISPESVAGRLTCGEKKLLELARVFLSGEKIIILKDFFDALDLFERERVSVALRKFTSRGGAVIICSTDIDELKKFCDRIVALNDEQNQRTYTAAEFDSISWSQNCTKKAAPSECKVIFRAINLCLPNVFSNVNIRLCRGEIIGIVGLMDSGIHELGMALCGAIAPERGRITVKGRRIKSIRGARKRKLVYISGAWGYDTVMNMLACSKAQIFILDTVLRGLNSRQSSQIERSMRDICASGGAIIYISRHTTPLLRICDRIAVMRCGEIICEFSSAEGYSKQKTDMAVLT